MKTKRIIQTLTALFLAAGLYAGGAAADEGHRPSKKSGKEKTGMEMMGMKGKMGMMGMTEEMKEKVKEHHQAMKARMDSLDARLEEKLETAKKARGDEKVDALIAVVEELIAQRKAMRNQMMDMMPAMMKMCREGKMMEGMHEKGGTGSETKHPMQGQ